nr:immunoglobulin light chain junction region [Macaca mulatta]
DYYCQVYDTTDNIFF